ncbi:ABC transporter permease [Propionibacterium freudenreichii]|uniref:ABC transporter permease n=1 Tax=Propionibacterium freudenreichii TaxID=1744 RepID=UPI00254CAE67|nr:ABC transporter permease [Propionibacterium freudenreichii]MDK9672212.1 ABC transporter permease [Propionibacterium freudenreichii]
MSATLAGRLTTPLVPVADRRWARYLVPVLVPALLVAIYQLISGSSPYLPGIGEIAAASRQMWTGAGFSANVVPSLTNLAVGYLAGLVLGLAVGVALGRAVVLRELLAPVIAFGLNLPGVAMLPVFLIAFGIGPRMQQGVIAFAVFFVVVINTTAGVRNTEPLLVDMARVYRLPRWRRICQVILPAASVSVLAGARVGLSAALLVMVVGEMVGASNGIGAQTLLAQQNFDYAQMWAGIVLLAALGIVLNLGFLAAERRLTHRLRLPAANLQETS